MKDNGEILKFADEIEYIKFPCEKLSILKKEGKLYIESCLKDNSNLHTYKQTETFKNFLNSKTTKEEQIQAFKEYEKKYFLIEKVDKHILLSSLISLRQRLSYIDIDINILSRYVNNSYLISLEEQLTKEDIKLIINWCKKYGLPFLGDPTEHFVNNTEQLGETYKYFGFENELLSCILDSKTYFRVGVFLVGLDILYKTLVYAININGNIKLNVDINTENLPIIKADFEDLTHFINTFFKSVPLHFSVNFSNAKHLKYDISTETTLSVALYHLALCITSPNPNLRAIRCENCNNIFLSSRANANYCIGCNRTTRYRQRKKKEEIENGKHNKKKK